MRIGPGSRTDPGAAAARLPGVDGSQASDLRGNLISDVHELNWLRRRDVQSSQDHARRGGPEAPERLILSSSGGLPLGAPPTSVVPALWSTCCQREYVQHVLSPRACRSVGPDHPAGPRLAIRASVPALLGHGPMTAGHCRAWTFVQRAEPAQRSPRGGLLKGSAWGGQCPGRTRRA